MLECAEELNGEDERVKVYIHEIEVERGLDEACNDCDGIHGRLFEVSVR